MYKYIKMLMIFALILLVVACGSTEKAPPPTPETVEVPVTVEVTRIIEVEKEIEVEVTRIVVETAVETVEVEVPVEVTRIVEVEITPTPEPTKVAATTSSGTTSTTSGFSNSTLLTSMNTVRTSLLDLGGMLDGRTLYCDTWIERHDAIANMPTYDTSYANDIPKWAYDQYRAAINAFVFESKDLTINARESCVPGSSIPFQQWGTARQGINHAIDILQPAIKELGGE